MKRIHLAGLVCVVAVSCAAALSAQESAPAAEPESPAQAAPPAVAESVLRLIKFSGLVRDALGQPRTGVVGITFALYAEREGGSPLWLETQNVELDAEGGYTLLLGAASSEGLPLEIFASEEARWLGVQVQGEEEQARVLLVSVPYALKAADAETLGGKPLSAFVQVESESTSTSAPGEEAATSGDSEPAVTSGTAGRIAKFTNATDLGDSVMFESGGSLGVGTTTPTGFQVNTALGTEEAQGVDNFRLGIFLGTPRMILEDAGSPVWELDNAGGLFRIFNPGVLSFAIDPSGNVGVGTASPTGFQVNTALGTEEAQGVDNFRLGIYLGTPRMILEDAGSPVWELDNAGGTFRIFNPGLLRFAIDPSGNVGIGTSTPTQKLEVAGTVKATAFQGDGSGLTGLSGWSLTGNAGTTAGTNFLGTTDNVALELHVNSTRALRLEPNATSPNLIGGFSGNTVGGTVVGATIGGGGQGGEFPAINQVTADFGTVGGGGSNTASGIGATVGGGGSNTASGGEATVGGGVDNTASGAFGTVGGGVANTASEYAATVGGGDHNTASGITSTVAGGEGNQATTNDAAIGGGEGNQATAFKATVGGGGFNTASGFAATVGGGISNTASGANSTVPGGQANTALGDFSFAAGLRAKANHAGAFVWGDSTVADVASTAVNEFTLRASGGLRMVVGATPTEVFSIDGNGNVEADGDIKLGPSAGLFAPGGVENLRIVRGRVSSAGAVLAGSGFTASRVTTGTYNVNMSAGFNGESSPAVIPSNSSPLIPAIFGLSSPSGSFTVRFFDTSGTLTDTEFIFIAAGPR